MQMAGMWTVSFSNGATETFNITTKGSVTITTTTTNTVTTNTITVSDQQETFSTTNGWYMLRGDFAWYYLQVFSGGLKVERFCGGNVCGGVYNGTLGGYCCFGIGARPVNCKLKSSDSRGLMGWCNEFVFCGVIRDWPFFCIMA